MGGAVIATGVGGEDVATEEGDAAVGVRAVVALPLLPPPPLPRLFFPLFFFLLFGMVVINGSVS